MFRTEHTRTGLALGALALCLATRVPAQPAEPPAPGAPGEAFDVYEYRVLNNSVLPVTAVESAVYPFLGPNKTVADLEQARVALESAYRAAGYSTVYVDLPEQTVDNAIVRFKVTEGRLDRVRVTGSRYFLNGAIREQLPSAQPGTVPRFEDVQRDLLAINQASADRVVTPVLRAGRTPGTVDMELKVSDTLPAHASVRVDDRYTADTSRTRAGVNLTYGNLWQKFHSLSFQYQTAPEETSEARVLAATYVAPLSRPGAALATYIVDTNSDVATVGTLSVLGKGRIYGMRLIEPIAQGDGYSQGLTLGLDFKDFSENVQVDPTTGLSTPISYAGWTLGYNTGLRGERSFTAFDIAANFGIRRLGNSESEFENKRFKARPNYLYLRANLNEEYRLFGPVSLAGRLAGQCSVEPLVSNEQFSIGGADSVRGYLEASELGDYGASGSLELRTSLAPAWMRERGSKLYGLLFYEAGVVATLEPLPDQANRADLRSWGVGFRMAGFYGLDAALDWAYPLAPTSRVEVGDSRVHFSIQYGF